MREKSYPIHQSIRKIKISFCNFCPKLIWKDIFRKENQLTFELSILANLR